MHDANEIVVAAGGKILVADFADNPTLPDDSVEDLDALFIEVGIVTGDGATFHDAITRKNIDQWDSRYPARRIPETKETTLGFALRQWNRANMRLAFGGGEVTGDSLTGFKYTPPKTSDADDLRVLVCQWEDADRHFRIVVPRGMVTEGVESQLILTDAANLPLTFSAMPENDDDAPWFLLTDDPAFEETLSA